MSASVRGSAKVIVSVAGVILVTLVLGLALLPGSTSVNFIAPSNSYSSNAPFTVSARPSHIGPGETVKLTDKIKNQHPYAHCSVTNTVTDPHSHLHSKTVSIILSGSGKGVVIMHYPDHFSNNPSTHTEGKYSVSATLTCGYSTLTASTSFTVR